MRHNIVKVLGGDETVVIKVGLGKHLLYLFVSHILSQILSYPFQLHIGYISQPVDVEGREDLIDLGSAVLFT